MCYLLICANFKQWYHWVTVPHLCCRVWRVSAWFGETFKPMPVYHPHFLAVVLDETWKADMFPSPAATLPAPTVQDLTPVPNFSALWLDCHTSQGVSTSGHFSGIPVNAAPINNRCLCVCGCLGFFVVVVVVTFNKARWELTYLLLGCLDAVNQCQMVEPEVKLMVLFLKTTEVFIEKAVEMPQCVSMLSVASFHLILN